MDYTVLQETTPKFPPHIYTIDSDGMLIAFQNGFTYEKHSYSNRPLRFSTKGRTFRTIVPYDKNLPKYITTKDSCTCKGYMFYRKCKHIQALRNQ